jgi:hypothetical protein
VPEAPRPRRSPSPKVTTEKAALKSCFVIAPIGREGTDIRKRSDQILRHIIDPVVLDLGYAPALRADRISESGRITQQVIQHITDDDLIIADLTGSNPNVYYELALRHALGKPFVQMLAGDDALPFDIADQRTIMVDYTDLDSVAAAKEELRRQIEALHNTSGPIETPLSFSVDLAALRSSGDPVEKTNAEILELVQTLVRQSRTTSASRPSTGPDIRALRIFIERAVLQQQGRIYQQDLGDLITDRTTEEHDEWVDSIEERMLAPLSYRSDPDDA